MAATPLTAARPGSVRAINRDKRPLAAAKVWKGGLAACVAGFYQEASGAAGEVVVGRFTQTVDNSGGAAGALSAEIKFFRERNLFLLDNDAAAPVVVANRETACSILDDHTATLFVGGSVGAVVYDVTTEGVWVELPFPSSPGNGGQPNIQSGTSTLVAGTKAVSAKLTANSRIIVTMKDPGAGAITGFADFDVPAANRNVGAGTFVVNAIDATKATIATAVCTFDYLVIG